LGTLAACLQPRTAPGRGEETQARIFTEATIRATSENIAVLAAPKDPLHGGFLLPVGLVVLESLLLHHSQYGILE